MRHQILKLAKGKSTKAERRFVEILKRNRIPFRAKAKICGREIDFLVNNRVAVEIGNHSQNIIKNQEVLSKYSLLFFYNEELLDQKKVENRLIKYI